MMTILFKVLYILEVLFLRFSKYSFMEKIYYSLIKLRFYLHFRKSLVSEALNGSRSFRKTAKKHSKMVVQVCYKNLPEDSKKALMPKIARTFRQNLLLEVRID